MDKSSRFAEFLRRLRAAPVASDFESAYQLVCDTLNAVEDELSGIPFNPEAWRNDGRMYPPQMDNIRSVPARPDVRRFVSKGHFTLIGDNGAIEIQNLQRRSVFQKPGADGKAI